MPSTYSVITLAGALAKATGKTIVIVDAVNGGGSQNLATALPSLTEDQLDVLDAGQVVLGYDTAAEAQQAFNDLTVEARAGYEATGSMVDATIIYVGEIGGVAMSTSNPCGYGAERTNTHVFRDGQLLSVPPARDDAVVSFGRFGALYDSPGPGKCAIVKVIA